MHPSAAMQKIIERAYQTFQLYPLPQQFNICVPCCVSEDDARALRHTPLRELSAKVLQEWNFSAHLSQPNRDEVRYLVPRLLELLAQGECLSITEELNLKRVGEAHPESWKPEEFAILCDFSRQFICDLLSNEELNELSVWLVMFHFSGLSLAPLLDTAMATPGYWATVSLAWLLYTDRPEGKLRNAFVSGETSGEAIDRQINAWLIHSYNVLAERAAQAIEDSPSVPKSERTIYGIPQHSLVDESLCAMSDYQFLWSLPAGE